jgi:hypothetical protein
MARENPANTTDRPAPTADDRRVHADDPGAIGSGALDG